jgi:two-component system sporulation sensor kinase A
MADSPTVLVLDDDSGVRSTMERLLNVYGYRAATAETLDQAHALLQTTSIEAVILDVGLQGNANGLDLLHTIRQRPEFDKAPVLILTGATLSAAEEALITRHRGFLFYKPEGFDTLVRFLDVLTGRDCPH